jgi:ferredoxin-NADP reductase
MPERGAPPNVHPVLRRVLDRLSAFSSPLLVDDYLELINPLWSTRELRGRIEEIRPETENAATVMIKPGYRGMGHRPGQYLISITVKNVDEGKVSPYLVRRGRPGAIVSLGGVEGDFTLPEETPGKLLFISAGSGITPIMSMLRYLDHAGEMTDVAVLHSARHPDDVIFGPELRSLARRHQRFALHEQHTREHGRMGPPDLDRLCPDWKERESYLSGPGEMLDAFTEHYGAHGCSERLHLERFQPRLGFGEAGSGEGGRIRFLKSRAEAHSDGSKPILAVGEDEGLELPYGCREGICHTCVGELRSGRVRDLRNGEVSGQEGEMIRTCINAPEGPVEIDL